MEDVMKNIELIMKKIAIWLWEFFKIMFWASVAFCATAGVLIWRYLRKRKKSSSKNDIQSKE